MPVAPVATHEAPGTEGEMAERSATADGRQYGASWVDRLQASASGVPGGPWSAYLGLLLGAAILLAIGSWVETDGAGVDLRRVASAAYPAYVLALMAWLDMAALRALHAFRPALHEDAAQVDRLRFELTVLPAAPTAMVTILFGCLAVITAMLDPEGRGLAGLAPGAAAVRLTGDIVGISLLGVLLYHTLHQLRAVARAQAAASTIDLFRPAPLHAFSPVTAQTGIGLLAIPAYGLVTDPRGWSASGSFVVIGVTMVVATVAFLLPLVGMNRRIRLERDRLQTEVGGRLHRALIDLHEHIDARDDDGMMHADRTLIALGREWELLDRLPTWPWRGTTLGAFASAMLVPITLWLIQRLLEHVV